MRLQIRRAAKAMRLQGRGGARLLGRRAKAMRLQDRRGAKARLRVEQRLG
jgi:hypothetical protein